MTRFAWVAGSTVYHVAVAKRAFRCGVYGGRGFIVRRSQPPPSRQLCLKCLDDLFKEASA